MARLYQDMASLPPQLQMFMRGCPPELEAKRHRINCRELVMRNLLALSVGVRRTVCWNLAPDIPGYENPLSVMDLLFGKLALLDYEGAELSHRHPAADTSALLAGESPASTASSASRSRAGQASTCSRSAAAAATPSWWSGSSATLQRRGRPPGPVRLALAGDPGAAAGVHHPAARQRRLTASPAGCRILGAWIFR